MDDHIIQIGSVCDGHWHMTIDLKQLAASAGVRKKEPDGTWTDPRTGETEVYKGSYYVDLPMTKAKRLLKLIRRYYRTEADLAACDKYFAENEKLMKAWRDTCEWH